MREQVPYFMQDYQPDLVQGLVPDGLHAQLPYVDPIFDIDVIQEVSDIVRPDVPDNVDGIREFVVSEDWHPDFPFRPGHF